jgi:uncharacterized Zn-finger protein
MAGTNEINSSQNVTDGICYRGNHEASASQKTLSCPNEVHICHQCDKRFQSIDSLNGHMSCHQQDEYKPIRISERTGLRNKRLHQLQIEHYCLSMMSCSRQTKT